MDLYDYMFGDGEDTQTDDMLQDDEQFQGLDAFFGLDTPSTKVGGFSTKNAPAPTPDLTPMTAKELGSLALDFTPIIGDIKGGYETVQMIQKELDRENPNYYLIGALGGLGAVGTIVGLVPAVGDAAQKAIMSGARMAAEKSGELAGELTGTARAVRDGDLDFIRGRGTVEDTQDLSASRVIKGSDYFNAPRGDGGRAKDDALFTPFSLNAKQKEAPYNWQVESEELGNLNSSKLITPSDNEGFMTYFVAGDRTAGDINVKKLGDLTLKRPVRMNAGPEYMDTGEVWASHNTVMNPKDDVLQEFSKKEDIKLAYAPMGERSGDFAKHQGELFSEYMYSADMPPETIRAIDDEFAKIVENFSSKELAKVNKARAKKDLPPLPNAQNLPLPSVGSEAFRDWFSTQSAEQIRKPFMQRVDNADIKALEGAPDVGYIRFASTNPDLIDAESFSTGYRFGTPDLQKGLMEADHPSYDTKYTAAQGTGSETYGTNIPWIIGARNTALPRLKDAALKDGYRIGSNTPLRTYTLPSDQRVFTMNPKTKQPMDSLYVEQASKFIELQNEVGQKQANDYVEGLLMDYLKDQ